MKRIGGFKAIKPSPLEPERVDACTKGKIKHWFDTIAKQVDVTQ